MKASTIRSALAKRRQNQRELLSRVSALSRELLRETEYRKQLERTISEMKNHLHIRVQEEIYEGSIVATSVRITKNVLRRNEDPTKLLNHIASEHYLQLRKFLV